MIYSKSHYWNKRGLIYAPDGDFKWSATHAQVPVVDYLAERNILRVYFATRDELNRSSIAYIDLDADNPNQIVGRCTEPLLKIGKLGTFDDCGVMPSCVVNREGEKWLYYIGWNVRNSIPYHNSVGLAISRDGGDSFEKFSEGPLWDRNWIEPHFSASSEVIFEEGIWKNWYLSCVGWHEVNGKAEPRYHLKYAESKDGINWDRRGHVAIDFKNDEEGGIVKATVKKVNGEYLMWFAYRALKDYRTDWTASYRIGFATSKDGKNWKRDDSLSGIDLSESGWDSEMITYPHVLEVKGKLLMFYNGNGFGKSGFGYAEHKFFNKEQKNYSRK